MADMGGVQEIMIFCLSFLIFPVSIHSFYMQAIKFLFLARTDDPKFFLPMNPNKKLNKWISGVPNHIDENIKEEI